MKRILFASSLLFLLHFTINSQVNIEWKQFASPDSSYRAFKYMSKGGDLYFVDKYTNETYASFDYGKTWELLFFPFIQGAPGQLNPFNEKLIEDSEGNLYFIIPKYIKVQGGYASNNSLLYKFDRKTKITEFLYDFLSYGFIIEDFKYIKDNELLLTSKTNKILLFDVMHRKIKRSINIKINYTKGQIYHSPGYKTYINIGTETSGNYANVIQQINDTLGLIGDKIESPFTRQLFYSKGRFFIPYESKYSDDEGKTWKQLDNFLYNIGTFEIGHNGYIFGELGSNQLFSKDNGDSFQILDNYEIKWYTSDTSGVILKTISSECSVSKENYISYDEGKQWEEIRPNLDAKPYAHSVAAGLNGNLIAHNFCSSVNCFTQKENRWETPLNKFNNVFYSHPILPLPDGSLYVGQNYLHYNIKSDFDTMVKCNFNNFLLIHDVKVKNNKLFMDIGGEIAVSEDFINVKEKFSFNGIGVDKNWIATNYKLFQSITNNNFNFRMLDLKTKKTTPLQLPIGTQVIESSYAGNNIYALQDTFSGVTNRFDYYIHISNDNGISFEKILVAKNLEHNFISMQVDHNENIYILLPNKLFVSINEGHNWLDITPKSPDLLWLTGLSISYDNQIYLSTLGLGILKTEALKSQDVKYLHVSAKRDINFNCVKNTEDTSIVYGVVRLANGDEKPLNNKGETWVSLLNDTTNLFLNVNQYAQVCNNNIQVSSNGADSVQFLVKAYDCEDLKVGLSTEILRRCFDNTYQGFIKNEGTIRSRPTTLNITLDTFFEFNSSNLNVISYNHPFLKLAVPEIEVGQNFYFNLFIKVNCNALLGQEHCISADIDSANPCIAGTRSNYYECQKNVGSYDPNDKAIFVAGIKDENYIKPDDKIEYLIRFQNTGTDTAFNVKIEDYISPKYDITTFRPTAASHSFDWEIKRNRKLVVYFNDILLVDSFKNEPGSHGFIKFEIKLDTLATMLGDTLSNTANIYSLILMKPS